MKQPHPYQKEGAAFLAGGGSLLADEAGLGKTYQAIEAAKAIGAKRVLILCPAVALGVWKDEIHDCWKGCLPFLLRDVVTNKQIAHTLAQRMWDGCGALITGYEYLLGAADPERKALRMVVAVARKYDGFDVLILDEAHKLKNPTAQTTMMVYGALCAGGPDSLVGMAKRTSLLTATPQLNHPGEWYPHLRALAPDRLPMASYDVFTHRYCTFKIRTITMRPLPGQRVGKKKQIETIEGANRAELPDLARRLRGFWLRRRISDVRSDLPPLLVVTRSLEPELCDAEILKEVADSPEAEVIRKAIERGDPEALSRIEGQVSRIRRLLAMAKVNATVDWVESLLDQGVQKVAVWGWHVEALNAVALGTAIALDSTQSRPAAKDLRSVLVTGGTTLKDRQDAQRRFQTDPTCRVFVGQIQAAGTAIDLDAADRAVFMEQAWTPALNYQALMRHRRSAKAELKPLLAEVLAVRGSIDHAVAEILTRKAQDISMLEDAS